MLGMPQDEFDDSWAIYVTRQTLKETLEENSHLESLVRRLKSENAELQSKLENTINELEKEKRKSWKDHIPELPMEWAMSDHITEVCDLLDYDSLQKRLMELNSDNKSLKTAEQALQKKIMEAEQLICNKHLIIAKQEREIGYCQQLLHDLKEQQTMREQHGDEGFLATASDDSTDYSLLEITPVESADGIFLRNTLLELAEESFLETEAVEQGDDSVLKNPAAEAPNGRSRVKNWWYNYAKPLIVGISFGVTTVAMVILDKILPDV